MIELGVGSCWDIWRSGHRKQRALLGASCEGTPRAPFIFMLAGKSLLSRTTDPCL
jgi:hypothetical protein